MVTVRAAMWPITAWSAAVAVAVGVLLASGDPLSSTAIYLAVWLVSTVVPGLLLWRTCMGHRTWSQDLGFGAATGIGWVLLGSAVATSLGTPRLLWLWPVTVITAFAVVPRLRHHWRLSGDETAPVPGAWHVAMAAVCTAALLRLLATTLARFGLPPEPQSYFRDLWYHLGFVEELTRTWRPQDPAVAGEQLRYHWFADAHMAATQVLSGVPGQEIVLHLWIVPMLLTLLLVTGAVAECLSGRWWAGPLAATAVGVLPVTLNLVEGIGVSSAYASGFQLESHSSSLAVVVLLALVPAVSDILCGSHRPGTWVVTVLLVVVAAGTKPTLLPVVLAGTLLAAVATWVVERRPPIATLCLAAVVMVVLPLAAVTVTGSTGGSRLQLLGLLNIHESFVEISGDTTHPASGGWLVNGLVGAGPSLWLLAMAFVVALACSELPRLLAAASPLRHAGRHDPVAWWVAGVLLSGLGATWVLSHPAFSQLYFLRTVESLGAAASVAVLARAIPTGNMDRGHARALAVVAAAAIAAAAAVRLAWPAPDSADLGALVITLLVPYVLLAVVLAASIVLVRQLSSPSPLRPGLFVLTAAFVLAAAVPGAVVDTATAVRERIDEQPPDMTQAQYLTRGQQMAALWLKNHSGADDVVVTNVLCSPPRYRPHCLHDSFWVSALTGRRLVLGGWSYTARSLTEASTAGLDYRRVASPWPDRRRLSLAAVRRPTPAVLDRLQQDYDAGWVFADRKATSVSPRLGRLADLRFSNADVAIYQLRDTGSVSTRD